MLIFNVFGNPAPQKQTRFSCRSGRPICYDPSSKDKEYIQWQIKPTAPENLILGPIELTLLFFLEIPRGTPKLKRTQMLNRVLLPNKKPDEDNLAYIVTNAMKGLVYVDDSQICAKHVYKFYGAEPKTVIRVRPILTMERLGLDVDEFLHPK
jgi:Holliday junction resolvase RusA-like endonuclease